MYVLGLAAGTLPTGAISPPSSAGSMARCRNPIASPPPTAPAPRIGPRPCRG
jgi:hypothetical protein